MKCYLWLTTSSVMLAAIAWCDVTPPNEETVLASLIQEHPRLMLHQADRFKEP